MMHALVSLVCGELLAQRSASFELRMRNRISVTWQDQELGSALERLTSAGRISLWLDRRVDRQQTISIQLANVALKDAIQRIAEQQSLGFTRLESLVYVGPQQSALELETLLGRASEQLAKTPTKMRRRWLQSEEVTWPRLSEPRSLAESWLRRAEVRLIGGDMIPHDLWPQQTYPSLALVDRLVLLLAGFDRTCNISPDGMSCEVVPIPRPLKLAESRTERKKPGASRSKTATSLQRFTLRLKNQPLGRVLDQLAQQLQLDVRWEDAKPDNVKAVRARLASCDVKNVDLDELLESVLSSVDLQHQRDGKTVTIRDAP